MKTDRALLLALSTVLWLGMTAQAQAYDPLQRAHRAAAQGQHFMAEGDTLAALDAMLRAQALAPEDPEIRAGLAETLYDGGEFDASIRQFEPLAGKGARPLDRRQALYNAGNAAFELQDYERALDHYTGALLAADELADDDLLHNLELAQVLLEQQNQQSEQSEESDEESEPQDGEQSDDPSEDQQSEGDQPPPEDQPPPPEQDESESEPDSTQQQSPPPPQEQEAAADSTQAPPPELDQMTPEEAMRLLEALDFDEEELRNSIQRRLRGDDEEDEHDW